MAPGENNQLRFLFITVQSEMANLIPILLTANIITVNEESDKLTAAIFKWVKMKGIFPTPWKQIYNRIFGTTHNIPDFDNLALVKLADHEIILIYVCNTAKKIDQYIGKGVLEMVRASNIAFDDDNNENTTTSNLKMYGEYCYQHLCHTHIKNRLNKPFSKYLVKKWRLIWMKLIRDFVLILILIYYFKLLINIFVMSKLSKSMWWSL